MKISLVESSRHCFSSAVHIGTEHSISLEGPDVRPLYQSLADVRLAYLSPRWSANLAPEKIINK